MPSSLWRYYSGFAGAGLSLCVFDEGLSRSISESMRRLSDESAPSPMRRVSGRLTVSYASYLSEGDPLGSLYRKAMAGVARARIAGRAFEPRAARAPAAQNRAAARTFFENQLRSGCWRAVLQTVPALTLRVHCKRIGRTVRITTADFGERFLWTHSRRGSL